MSDAEKYRAILEKDPTDTQAFVDLCGIAERSRDFEYLANLYKYRAQVIKDKKEIADLYFKAGEVYLDKISDLTRGVEALLQGFDCDRSHAGIGDRLDAIYREASDWEATVQVLEQRLETLTDIDATGTKVVIRSDLHQQAGEIWERVYQDHERALDHYRKAIELDKTNLLALYSAREIYYAAGKYKNAAKLCELEARSEKDTARRIALYKELAHLLSDHLSDTTQAVLALKRALKLAPDNEETRMELARTISKTPITSDNTKDHKWAADFLLRMAKKADLPSSVELARRSVQAMPDSTAALEFLESRATEAGAVDQLVSAYEAVIESKTDIESQAPIIRRLAKLYVDEMGSPEDALGWLEKLKPLGQAEDERTILQLSKGVEQRATKAKPQEQVPQTGPASDAAPSEAALAAPSTEAHQAPAAEASAPSQVTPQAASTASEDIQADPASTMSRVERQAPEGLPEGMKVEEYIALLYKDADKARRQGDDVTAEDRMLEVLDHSPQDQKATTYLERRFRARGDWLSLRDLLTRSAGAAHLPQAVQTVRLREAARISEEQLSDINGAIDVWNLIREIDPKVRDAGDALSRLLAQAERWEDLLKILKIEAETTKSRTKRVEAYRRIADVNRIRLNDVPAATAAFQMLLSLSPGDTAALEALDEIYLREQDYEQLVPLLQKRAELSQDKGEKRDLLLRVVVTLRERLDRPDDAYELAKEILAISQNDEEVLGIMASIDEEGEHWGRLLNTMDLMVRTAADPATKAGFLRKKASIAIDKFQDTATAVKALTEILAFLPNDFQAMDDLTEIYRTSGEWDALVTVLRKRLDAIDDEGEQAELHRNIAKILETKLEKTDEAMESWCMALEIEEDVESLGALSRYYERYEDWDAYIDVLQKQAPYAEDHGERADILYKRAIILFEALGEQDQAVAEFKKIVDEVFPNHLPTLEKLRQILVDAEQYEEAAEILEKQITNTEDQAGLKALLVLLGGWYRKEIGDMERAAEAFERAARIDSNDDDLLDTLDEVYAASEAWDNLLNLMHHRFQNTLDEDDRLDMAIRAGTLCEETLEDTKRAWIWYRLAFKALGHMPRTIDVVEEAARRMEMWQPLIDEIYGVLATTAENTDEQVDWWMKIADVFEEKLEDAPKALEAVLRAFGLDPEKRELLDSVDRLAIAGKNWQRLSTVYGVLIQRSEQKQDKIDLLVRYANLLAGEEGQVSQAFDISLKAFELDPNSDALLAIVEQIGESAERWDDLVRVYNVCAKLAEDTQKKVELKLKAVYILRDRQEDPDSALQHIFEVIRVNPFLEDITSRAWTEVRNLEDDLVSAEKGIYWGKLTECYRQLADEHQKDRLKQADLLMVVARIYIEELDDISAAFECLKEVQQVNPRDEETIDKLEALAGGHNYWEALTDHYQDILDETFEMDIAIMLHRRRARILEEELDRPDEASEHYWQIIQLDASDHTGYEKLLSHYEKAEKWNELVNLLERQLDHTQDQEDKKRILLHIAAIWETDIKNRFEAVDWYEQVLAIWPDDREAKQALERLSQGQRSQDAATDEEDEDIQSLFSIPTDMSKDEAENTAEEAEALDTASSAEDELPDVEDELPDVEDELPDVEDELSDAEGELPDAEDDLSDVEDELPDVEDELPDVEDELSDAEGELPDAEDDLSNAEDELPDAEDNLSDAEDDLLDAEDELPDEDADQAVDGEESEDDDLIAPDRFESSEYLASVSEETRTRDDLTPVVINEGDIIGEADHDQVDDDAEIPAEDFIEAEEEIISADDLIVDAEDIDFEKDKEQ
ncbi:MAG: hypothetical protein QNJ97_24710 [Myxococcota bacterium]|nr:hypothetical protein [Myxococcota bacterium]